MVSIEKRTWSEAFSSIRLDLIGDNSVVMVDVTSEADEVKTEGGAKKDFQTGGQKELGTRSTMWSGRHKIG
ncbi:hypothetical protein CCR75_007403 [Bremia lactucae]|uniref:Uncharacterized protein n=1 Tax=Bremia lactucae TaxID=4779 RepID=A0A976NZI6_BRELC|nr:hypothetical protein CCR75_007403 [Bremia lactucae]